MFVDITWPPGWRSSAMFVYIWLHFRSRGHWPPPTCLFTSRDSDVTSFPKCHPIYYYPRAEFCRESFNNAAVSYHYFFCDAAAENGASSDFGGQRLVSTNLIHLMAVNWRNIFCTFIIYFVTFFELISMGIDFVFTFCSKMITYLSASEIANQSRDWVIWGFRHGVNDVFAVLECYAAWLGSRRHFEITYWSHNAQARPLQWDGCIISKRW